MKQLLEFLFWFVLIVGCAKSDPPPSAGSFCTNNANVGGVVGNDGLCYTCTNGNYAFYGYLSGYCGSENSAGVSCCGNSYNVVCSKPGYPWLCSDGNCWSQANGNGSLYCVYDP